VEVQDVKPPAKHKYEIRVAGIATDDSLLVVEATYWNSFQKDEEWVSTYADADAGKLAELVTFVLGPDGREMHDPTLTESPDEGRTRAPFRSASTF
jgi:hypothetical protein